MPKVEKNRKIHALTLEKKTDTVLKVPFFMILEIDKINLRREIYPLDSPLNTVSKNIQLIEGSVLPDQLYSNVILASHSGNSHISYFKNLEKLEIGDTAFLYYQSNYYTYKLVTCYQEIKDGSIVIHRKKKRNHLILITCDKQNKQLQNVYVFEKC